MRILLLLILLAWAGSLFLGSQSPVPSVPLPAPSHASGVSANWSGYVANAAHSYTQVGGSWVVPKPAAQDAALAGDATWAGIGGLATRDLIQAGTQATIEDGTTKYVAWYEMLPEGQHIIPLSIRPGDQISVSLAETLPNSWNLSFTDQTTGRHYATNLFYQSSRSSAEWIEEAPAMQVSDSLSLVPLDNFGTIHFSGGYAVADGARQSIAQAAGKSVTMIDGSFAALASPGALSADGASFAVARTDTPTTLAQSSLDDSRAYRREDEWGGGRRRVVVYVIGQ